MLFISRGEKSFDIFCDFDLIFKIWYQLIFSDVINFEPIAGFLVRKVAETMYVLEFCTQVSNF
ncbi:hypothetical protein SAMN04487995_2029 [Dyadobacter koreensis]|uniref:Uncharacterized protein n=1 Tax=Dyadobacter koreensis TaxID=408657 RepID=A0A1H6T5J6_9BACT|nr:hypothetical protein SAMN04487995_2029 [Dyadobacter koreensis]